ncbi:hypothetical protein CsSME_00000145 [Camellia sinensis var. sinensis]
MKTNLRIKPTCCFTFRAPQLTLSNSSPTRFLTVIVQREKETQPRDKEKREVQRDRIR